METPQLTPKRYNAIVLLRASDVAKVLNISAAMAYKLMQSGDIPTVRMSRSVRVRQEDLDEYIIRCWSGWNQKSRYIN